MRAELLTRRRELQTEANAVSEKILALAGKQSEQQGLVENLKTLAVREAEAPPGERTKIEAERRNLLSRKRALDELGAAGERLEDLRRRELALSHEMQAINTQLMAGAFDSLKAAVACDVAEQERLWRLSFEADARVLAWRNALVSRAEHPDVARAGLTNAMRGFAANLRVFAPSHEWEVSQRLAVDVSTKIEKILEGAA